MNDRRVISGWQDLLGLAQQLREGPQAPPQAARDALNHFLMGDRPAGLPNEAGTAIDFASSIVVAQTPNVTAQLVVAKGIDQLGPIIRDGVLPPYMHGTGLKLRSDIVTDPLLQRTGCLKVCTEAGLQHVVQLLLALPETTATPMTGWTDDQRDWFKLSGEIRQWERDRAGAIGEALKGLLLHVLGRLPNGGLESWLRVELAEAAKRWQKSERPPLADLLAALREAFDMRHEPGHIDTDRARTERQDTLTDLHWIVQGAGDLSFNEWNVALVRSANASTPTLIIPPGEPFSQRRYRCLVGWKHDAWSNRAGKLLEQHVRAADTHALLGTSLAMLELEFSPGHVSLPPCAGLDRLEITDAVEFAVFGKSLIWGGRPVPKHQVAEQFRDIRHLFALPLVPATSNRHDSNSLDSNSQDIYAFGQKVSGDFWALERALLEDANLLRLACLAAIEVPLDALGVPQYVITDAFLAAGYTQQERPAQVNAPGQFAWGGAGRKRLHVFLRPAAYPCSMVALGRCTPGATQDVDALYCLAWGHGFERGRFRLWEDCAAALQALGATHALVMDEGLDVFQVHVRSGAIALFSSADKSCNAAALAAHMPVPFAFEPGNTSGSGGTTRHYLRPAMRASLNFKISVPAEDLP